MSLPSSAEAKGTAVWKDTRASSLSSCLHCFEQTPCSIRFHILQNGRLIFELGGQSDKSRPTPLCFQSSALIGCNLLHLVFACFFFSYSCSQSCVQTAPEDWFDMLCTDCEVTLHFISYSTPSVVDGPTLTLIQERHFSSL